MRIVLLEPDEAHPTQSEGPVGEIALLGRSVSLGYLDDPELTSSAYFEIDGERGFRTADLGRLEGGSLFIEGRKGARVKIAGHRVDLAEVENAFAQLDGVFLAAVFVHETVPGLPELWACVTGGENRPDPDIFSLKQALRSRLPRYMVPKRILVLASLPLNTNGKVDRKAAKLAALATL